MNTATNDIIHVDYSSLKEPELSVADEAAKKKYEEYGCFLARGLLEGQDLEPVQHFIQRLIALRAEVSGVKIEPEADGLKRFDDGFTQIDRVDRKNGSIIFDACRRLLPLHQLSVHPRLIHLAEILMGTDLIMASDVKAIRVDRPGDEKYLFDWHQDYPYIMDSEDAIVFWIPMQDVNPHNGGLKIALGSHKLGLLKVRINDLRNQQDNKQKFMEIADRSLLDRFPKLSISAQAGDVLVFSTMLLHAGQGNQSHRPRWTVQVRFGNFADPQAIQREWPGSLRDGSWFDQQHPEYVVNLPELLRKKI